MSTLPIFMVERMATLDDRGGSGAPFDMAQDRIKRCPIAVQTSQASIHSTTSCRWGVRLSSHRGNSRA